jgi:hypothetical protein
VALLLTVPGVCWGGARDHDDGFFLRLSSGVGHAGSEISWDSHSMKVSGIGGDANIAIGGIIAPDLAVHGTLNGWFLSDPEVELDNSTGDLPGDFYLSAFGGGVTYYLMPANVYLSASVGVGMLTVDVGNVSVETDMGPVVDVTIGKEWWVGDEWGLGVAGTVGYHSIADPDVDENWSGISVGLRFSATYN